MSPSIELGGLSARGRRDLATLFGAGAADGHGVMPRPQRWE